VTPTVLVIAGLDPSAGAGLLADARVCAEHGVRAVGVITAATVQDTEGVRAVSPIAPEEVGDALRALLGDLEVQAVKIGMLGRSATARTIVDSLAATRAPAVWDPVIMPSRGGVPLLQGDLGEAAGALLPEVRLVTPNLDEIAALVGGGGPPKELLAMVRAAASLRRGGVAAVLCKGGHLGGAESPDVLDDGGDVDVLTGPRFDVGPTHGTGCVLSTAIACGLAKGKSLPIAVREAKQYVSGKLEALLAVGRGARVLV
jgi:hydroxymethylpyrimidine/phosphomethylpyrimidine kinase